MLLKFLTIEKPKERNPITESSESTDEIEVLAMQRGKQIGAILYYVCIEFTFTDFSFCQTYFIFVDYVF